MLQTIQDMSGNYLSLAPSHSAIPWRMHVSGGLERGHLKGDI